MFCHGNGEDHCCWIEGKECEFLEAGTVPGRIWACMLYRELGSWGAVYADPRYLGSSVKAWLDRRFPGYGCGDYPQNIPEIMDQPKTGKCCYGA